MSQPSTSVDLGQLENAARWLEQIKQFIETHCVGAMPTITEALGSVSNVDMSDTEYQLTQEATVFGGFYSAYGMQARNDGVYRAVQTSLEEFARRIGEAAAITNRMIENYQAVEQRNLEMNADFERALTTPPSSTPPSSYA
jgi:hypothetical protein